MDSTGSLAQRPAVELEYRRDEDYGSTDLTVGLVYANRGEYLLEEDPERTFGVNLGLKLKFGSNGEEK